MDEGINQSLERFRSVWQRVAVPSQPPETEQTLPPVSPSPGEGEQARLRLFLERETELLSLYRALSRRTGNSAAGRLFSDTQKHLRRLQTEYFLLTGDTLAPPPGQKPPAGVLPLLRRAYLSEGELAEQYEAAGTGPLRELYLARAEATRSRRETLRGMIARALG